MELSKPQRVFFKNHPELNARWLQDRSAEELCIFALSEEALPSAATSVDLNVAGETS